MVIHDTNVFLAHNAMDRPSFPAVGCIRVLLPVPSSSLLFRKAVSDSRVR
jgi:hypothetical protein